MPDRSHLSIGEVLSLLREEFPDVTISKIRFLESQGLVDPERTPSGYRKFYDQDVERLRWILRQQREHFLPLKVIRGRLNENAETTDSGGAAGDPDGTGEHRPRSAALRAPETTPHLPGLGPSGPFEESEPDDVGETGSRATAPQQGRVPAARPASREETGGGDEHPSLPSAGHADPAEPEAPPIADPAARRALSAVARSAASAERGPSRPARASSSGLEDTVAAAPSAGSSVGKGAPADEDAALPGGGASQPDDPPAGSKRPPASSQKHPAPPVASSEGRDTFSADELADIAGATPALVAELKQYGLITSHAVVAGTPYFDESALAITRAAAGFAKHGVEARHLRAWRNAADREAGLFEQLILPLLHQRNPQARKQAAETVDELARLGGELRSALIERALKEIR